MRDRTRTGDIAMLPLVESRQIVHYYAPWFESVLSAQALVQFQPYPSRLILFENKTMDGISRLFAHPLRATL